MQFVISSDFSFLLDRTKRAKIGPMLQKTWLKRPLNGFTAWKIAASPIFQVMVCGGINWEPNVKGRLICWLRNWSTPSEILSLISKMMGLAKGIFLSDEGIWSIYSMLNFRVLLVHESFLVWSSMNLTNHHNVLDSAGKILICVNFYGRICEKFYPPGN